MLLILQIAAGIVLGWLIIVHHQRLVGWIKAVASALLGFLLFGAIIFAVGAGGTALITSTNPFLMKVMDLIGVVFALGCAGVGGYGLWLLIHELPRKRPRKAVGEGRVFLLALANALLVYAVSWPVLAWTSVGQWYAEVDRWSRANGHADSGTFLIAAISWLWPLIPLVLIWSYRDWVAERKRRDEMIAKGK